MKVSRLMCCLEFISEHGDLKFNFFSAVEASCECADKQSGLMSNFVHNFVYGDSLSVCRREYS